jgi:transposase-like protein
VANRPFYAAISVGLQGRRDVLGIWAGTPGAGESSKYWISILTELKNRGVTDIFYLVCDGLKGMPESVNAVFKDTIVQTCVVHLIRNTFKYSSQRYWPEIARDLKPVYTKPVYTAVNADAALIAFEAFDEKWGERYPAIGKLWRAAWDNFVPFLAYDVEIRRVLCSTDEIVNAAAGAGVTASCRACSPPVLRTAARSRGQGGAPGWRNDLDRGEDRSSLRGWWAWSTAERRAARWDCKCCRAA